MQATSTVTGVDQRTVNNIQTLLGSGPKLDANDLNVQDFSRLLHKMGNYRFSKENTTAVVNKLFEIASTKMKDDHDKAVLESLRTYVGLVEEDLYQPKPRYLDAFFFPCEANVDRLVSYLGKAQKTMEICVFNVTNDKLAQAVVDAHKRGVKVRVVTDDEQSKSNGSDIQRFANEGILVRSDNNEKYHMHNKYVVIDGTHLITGSFNWTYQAGSSNQENLLVVDHPYYIQKYQTEFENLWKQFSKNQFSVEQRQEQAATTIQNAWRSRQARR